MKGKGGGWWSGSKHYTAPPRGNIPDGIKELTLQTVNIPTRGSQQETGGLMGVGGCMSMLYSGLWLVIFQFISLSVAGVVKEKPKGLNGRSWMGGPAGASRNTFFYLFVSQRAHLLLADERRTLMVGQIHTLVKHSTNWKCQFCQNDSSFGTHGYWSLMLFIHDA